MGFGYVLSQMNTIIQNNLFPRHFTRDCVLSLTRAHAMESGGRGCSKADGYTKIKHFFFVCPFYKVQRVQMMNDLSQYITGIPRLSHILYGNDALSETYNKLYGTLLRDIHV